MRRVVETRTSLPAAEVLKHRNRKRFPMSVVYWVTTPSGECLYVGQTAYCVRTRLQAHKASRSALGIRLRRGNGLMAHWRQADINRASRMREETEAIKQLKPVLNV